MPEEPAGYRYDVFLSYRRSGAGGVAPWVRNHFLHLLTDCLADEMAGEPRIFIDERQDLGGYWPATLARALDASRVLVPVWSPKYFTSRWCVAEWQTILRREQLFGLATERQPLGLVYPVVFSDGDHFPNEARHRQAADFKKWAVPAKSYRKTRGYVGLHKAVREFAGELAPRLRQVPDWQAGWPAVRVDPPLPPPPTPPRLTDSR
jgi:hypothetical protein